MTYIPKSIIIHSYLKVYINQINNNREGKRLKINTLNKFINKNNYQIIIIIHKEVRIILKFQKMTN